MKLRLDDGDLRFEQTLYWLATEKLSPVARGRSLSFAGNGMRKMLKHKITRDF
ncbi:MAG: hypothetical protein LUD41_05210 [Phascolarctobacterium sp.]|nr:hypothetical protein [Phascolarctobacterium sp.]